MYLLRESIEENRRLAEENRQLKKQIERVEDEKNMSAIGALRNEQYTTIKRLRDVNEDLQQQLKEQEPEIKHLKDELRHKRTREKTWSLLTDNKRPKPNIILGKFF